jgi:peptide/nickel transport system permease protein
MLTAFIKSLLQAVLVMLAVAFLAFSMFRFVGDPVANMVGQEATVQDREELTKDLGLDKPFIYQFGLFVVNAAHGDFGISWKQARPVKDLMAEKLPATLELAFISMIFALSIGVTFGIFTAIKKDNWLSHFIMSISLVGVSLPTFLIGIGLIYVFSVELKWLPSFGRGDTVKIGWWTTGLLTASGIKSLVLPVITLGFFQLTLIMRLVRSQMLETLRADYIKFARARGVPERVVYFKHALKNTMIPVITITGLQLGSIIAFAIVTESVFQWPGMGYFFVNAIQYVDIPVMAAYLMFVAFVFVITNLTVDLLYLWLDPRLRVSK